MRPKLTWAAGFLTAKRRAGDYPVSSKSAKADSSIGVAMLKEIVEAEFYRDHRLFVRFEDGSEGSIDFGVRPILTACLRL